MRKLFGIMLTLTITMSFGCAGPGRNTTAGNVATGATINALAGVPGAGLVGAAAMMVEAMTNPSSSNRGTVSPELEKMVEEAPRCTLVCKYSKERVCQVEELEVIWKSRKKKDGSFATVENAPKRALEYTEALTRAAKKYWAGILGDTPEMQAANLKARAEGKTVVAEYGGPNGASIVYVSVDNSPVEVMTGEEWTARKSSGDPTKSGNLKEASRTPTDKSDHSKESVKLSENDSTAPKQPVTTSAGHPVGQKEAQPSNAKN